MPQSLEQVVKQLKVPREFSQIEQFPHPDRSARPIYSQSEWQELYSRFEAIFSESGSPRNTRTWTLEGALLMHYALEKVAPDLDSYMFNVLLGTDAGSIPAKRAALAIASESAYPSDKELIQYLVRLEAKFLEASASDSSILARPRDREQARLFLAEQGIGPNEDTLKQFLDEKGFWAVQNKIDLAFKPDGMDDTALIGKIELFMGTIPPVAAYLESKKEARRYQLQHALPALSLDLYMERDTSFLNNLPDLKVGERKHFFSQSNIQRHMEENSEIFTDGEALRLNQLIDFCYTRLTPNASRKVSRSLASYFRSKENEDVALGIESYIALKYSKVQTTEPAVQLQKVNKQGLAQARQQFENLIFKQFVKQYEVKYQEPELGKADDASRQRQKEYQSYKKVELDAEEALNWVKTTLGDDKMGQEYVDHSLEQIKGATQTIFKYIANRNLAAKKHKESSAYITLVPKSTVIGEQELDMLQTMYLRFAENAGFKVELIDHDERQRTFKVIGENAFGIFQGEHGSHRFSYQRKDSTSTTESRHMRNILAYVYPEIERPTINLDDLEYTQRATRSGGPGGQHVNTTDSAIQISTAYDGEQFYVKCSQHRSQHDNRREARKMILSRIQQYVDRKADNEKPIQDVERRVRIYRLVDPQKIDQKNTNTYTTRIDDFFRGNFETVRPFIYGHLGIKF